MDEDGEGLGRSRAVTVVDATATNTLHVAIAKKHCILVYDLFQPEKEPRTLQHELLRSKTTRNLALSHTVPDQLAVINGDQVLVFTVQDAQLKCVIPGVGRTVTSVSWSLHGHNVLALGAVDGTVTIRKLVHLVAQVLRHYRAQGAVEIIAFHPVAENVFASSHGSSVQIWSLKGRGTLLHTIRTGKQHVTDLAWHPTVMGRVLTGHSNGVTSIWSFHEMEQKGVVTSRDTNEDDDHDLFGKDELPEQHLPWIIGMEHGEANAFVDWIGERGVLIFIKRISQVRLYSIDPVLQALVEVWRQDLTWTSAALTVQFADHTLWLICMSQYHWEKHRIPHEVLSKVLESQSLDISLPQRETTKAKGVSGMFAETYERLAVSRMKPVSISQIRRESSFAKTSRQLHLSRNTFDSRECEDSQTFANGATLSVTTTPTSQVTTSSIELPNVLLDEDGLPTPVFSPSIPVREMSPRSLAIDEDSLYPPLLPSASFDHKPSTVVHESDSDDETFENGMRESASFMPGGVNVPLPKACGALFAPNGQLLTFFPSRARPPSAQEIYLDSEGMPGSIRKTRIARLFPAFGKLTEDSPGFNSISETSALNDGDLDKPAQSTFFDTQSSNKHVRRPVDSKKSRSLGTPAPAGQHMVVVNVHALGPLIPYQKSTAERYRILHDDGESGTETCQHNALVADQNESKETGDAWRLVALLLEDSTPLDLLYPATKDEDIVPLTCEASSTMRGDPTMRADIKVQQDSLTARCRPADQPLRSWLVAQLMEWAECRADLHMLAYLPAILAENQVVIDQAFEKLPPNSPDLLAESQNFHPTQGSSRVMPLLQRSSLPIAAFHESPTRLHQVSNGPSPNASQPATPYLGTSAGTPAFTFPPTSKHGSRLSTSGSVSPEYHRNSNSFSAASKHYARSITDRFASYGTSPPTKKDRISSSLRGANETLGGPPSGGSSLPKSVSFASTIAETNISGTSRSYDSDKTIEDTSIPHTLEMGHAGIAMILPNDEAFCDDGFGWTKVPLLPIDFTGKARVWCKAYAEQLRMWGLLVQAAELEKIWGLSTADHQSLPTADCGMIPHCCLGKQRADCSVCSNRIGGVEQLCPSCLHTAHLDCLSSYVTSLGPEERFECPTGCGCNCSNVPYTLAQPTTEHFVPKPEAAPAATKLLRKKGSFTDPRRWRARIEGDSW